MTHALYIHCAHVYVAGSVEKRETLKCVVCPSVREPCERDYTFISLKLFMIVSNYHNSDHIIEDVFYPIHMFRLSDFGPKSTRDFY